MTVYVGEWIFSSYPSNPATCVSSPSTEPLTQNWSWDAGTLTGTVETVRADQCGGPPTIGHANIALWQAA